MKHNLRRELQAVRKDLPVDYITLASKQIFLNFYSFLHQKPYQIIAAYYPINSELDILPLVSHLHEKGLTLALPYMNNSQPSFKEWETDTKLVLHKGFYQPPESSQNIDPDLIIVPLLGFDKQGNRIGYGGGFYDRILSLYPNACTVSLAYSKQEVKKIPIEEHDQPVNFIITEKDIIVCKQLENQ